jgi:hypothetical protein
LPKKSRWEETHDLEIQCYHLESWDEEGKPVELLAATQKLQIGRAMLQAAMKAYPGLALTLREKERVIASSDDADSEQPDREEK